MSLIVFWEQVRGQVVVFKQLMNKKANPLMHVVYPIVFLQKLQCLAEMLSGNSSHSKKQNAHFKETNIIAQHGHQLIFNHGSTNHGGAPIDVH